MNAPSAERVLVKAETLLPIKGATRERNLTNAWSAGSVSVTAAFSLPTREATPERNPINV